MGTYVSGEAGRSGTASCWTNPTLQAGDSLHLATDQFTGLVTIERLTLPYRSQDGERTMTLVVREVVA